MASVPAQPQPSSQPPRQTSIDYMKAVLVIGMVLAHALQLLSRPRGLAWLFSMGINLITFSGFFFCFGYVFYLVYFTKPIGQVRSRMLKTAWKTLLGYYFSAFASSLLLQHFTNRVYDVSLANILQIITLVQIPWYSEFLLSFFLITFLVVLLFNPIRWLLAQPGPLVGVGVACLLMAALLPDELSLPNALGLLIGTRTFAVFPVIPYLPIFLAGAYFAKHRIVWNRVVGGLSLAGTSLFVIYYVVKREMPAEFLPSVYWLTGSYGILYGYFLLTNWLERTQVTIPALLSIGRNTLLYLLLSNLMLFVLSNYMVLSTIAALGTGVGVLLTISFLISLVNPPPPVRRASPAVSTAPVTH